MARQPGGRGFRLSGIRKVLMRFHTAPVRPAALAAFVLLSGLASGAPAGGKPGARRPAAEWPVTVRLGDATAVVDAPQADRLDGTLLRASGAFRLRRPEEAEPAVGTWSGEADVVVDRSARVVTLASVRVTSVELPGAPPARQQRIAARFSRELTRLSMKLPLDAVLASAKLAPRRDEAAPKLG